jgi:16S rRNA (guanine(966)-N(2))-methyltransferase RsmD
MRITGGILRGRVLTVPNSRVRPTQDRVRAALFSMLGERVPGSRFLDLFAGTGAVGLEAASRGAGEAVWVEGDPHVFKILQRNVLALLTSLPGDASSRQPAIWNLDVAVFLKKFRERGRSPFDIVFADPPYGYAAEPKASIEWLLRMLRESGALADGGWAVVETDESRSTAPQGWVLLKERAYGSTRLYFFAQGPGQG